MHRFKVGQKVVAIRNSDTWKSGQVFTVEFLSCCIKCGEPNIKLTELNGIGVNCCACDTRLNHHEFHERNFAPIQSTTDAIEYKMKVSIPELITLKQYQEQ